MSRSVASVSELGRAIAALAQDAGGLREFARRLGFGATTIARWISGDTVPGPEAAEVLGRQWPHLLPLLEAKSAFVARVRKPPLGKGAQTRKQAAQKREACMVDVEAARAEIASEALPWPSEATKRARLPKLRAAAARRRKRRARKHERGRTLPDTIRHLERTGERRGRRRIDDALDFLTGDGTPSYVMGIPQ